MNRFSIASLVAGLLSLIIHLPLWVSFFIIDLSDVFLDINSRGIFIFRTVFASKVGGFLFGIIGLYYSDKAFKQVIEEGDDTRKGYRIATIGKVLSIFGMIFSFITLLLLRD